MLPSSKYHNANEQMKEQLLKMVDYVVTSANSINGSIATSNSFSDSLAIFGNGKAMLFLSGGFTATVMLQCSPSTASIPVSWYDLASYTLNGANFVDIGISCSLRVGIAINNYTSGTVNYHLQTGGRP